MLRAAQLSEFQWAPSYCDNPGSRGSFQEEALTPVHSTCRIIFPPSGLQVSHKEPLGLGGFQWVASWGAKSGLDKTAFRRSAILLGEKIRRQVVSAKVF